MAKFDRRSAELCGNKMKGVFNSWCDRSAELCGNIIKGTLTPGLTEEVLSCVAIKSREYSTPGVIEVPSYVAI
ncbi:hypothetical protein J6590_076758 [Homalodisca vitripennis]|nr:hypothetical protein J6590_076758 [Homalodisca vitripennis]